MYSDKVMDHFMNPRNVGEIENPDGKGRLGNPACGDIMEFYIKVKDDRLEDVKFKTFGCGAAISVSSMISELAIGKTLDEAMAIQNSDVAEELGGLPKNKLHCSNLGADALHLAIEDYRKKSKGEKTESPESSKKATRDDRPVDECPYCSEEITENDEFCSACKKKLEK